MKNDFRGARISGSAFGKNASVVNVHDGAAAGDELAELRRQLAALRGEIAALAGPEEQRSALTGALDRVDQAVAADPPDVEVVHSRWERLRSMLEPAGQLADLATKISDLVRGMLGG